MANPSATVRVMAMLEALRDDANSQTDPMESELGQVLQRAITLLEPPPQQDSPLHPPRE